MRLSSWPRETAEVITRRSLTNRTRSWWVPAMAKATTAPKPPCSWAAARWRFGSSGSPRVGHVRDAGIGGEGFGDLLGGLALPFQSQRQGDRAAHDEPGVER